VIRAAVAAGRLTPPASYLDDPTPFLRSAWVSPLYGMVDPESDVKGATAAIDANLSDQWTEAQRQGRNADDVLRQRARFYRLAADLERENGLAPGTLTQERPARSESVDPNATPAPAPGATPPKAPPAIDPTNPDQPQK